MEPGAVAERRNLSGKHGRTGLERPQLLRNLVCTTWKDRSPLGWDESDHEPTAKAVVALLSDFFPATTGEIVHVDGGFHAMGL